MLQVSRKFAVFATLIMSARFSSESESDNWGVAIGFQRASNFD